MFLWAVLLQVYIFIFQMKKKNNPKNTLTLPKLQKKMMADGCQDALDRRSSIRFFVCELLAASRSPFEHSFHEISWGLVGHCEWRHHWNEKVVNLTRIGIVKWLPPVITWVIKDM